jgi:CRISPR-associated protein Cas2
MYMIVSIDCKFKTNHENIEKVLEHFGLRKIQSSLYVGNLDNSERKELCEKISEIIRQTDSVLIIPICQNCYSKKISIGRIIQFRDELYRVY